MEFIILLAFVAIAFIILTIFTIVNSGWDGVIIIPILFVILCSLLCVSEYNDYQFNKHKTTSYAKAELKQIVRYDAPLNRLVNSIRSGVKYNPEELYWKLDVYKNKTNIELVYLKGE